LSTTTRTPNGKINQPVSPNRRPKETTPAYYDTQKPFGAELNNSVSMGAKYKTKYDENPAPGQYNVDESRLSTRKKS
jgi:hypothetical protein